MVQESVDDVEAKHQEEKPKRAEKALINQSQEPKMQDADLKTDTNNKNGEVKSNKKVPDKRDTSKDNAEEKTGRQNTWRFFIAEFFAAKQFKN